MGEGHRAHLTPIYASSTYTFESADQAADVFLGKEEGYIYGRFGNPTIREAEEKIALLEAHGLADADSLPLKLRAILHASGMAALSTLLFSTLKSGDAILTHHSLYGGTAELLEKILPGLGIRHTIIDFHDLDAVRAALTGDSALKMLYIETPANPTLQCLDGAAIAALGKERGLLVCADNTFATPYLQQPFMWGADYVMHSTTKALNGHGTAVGGVLIGRDTDDFRTVVTKTHRLLGANSNAFEAFLLTNGLRTLGLRMERHCDNAEKVAAFLEGHVAVARVNYPGLPSHPDHAVAVKTMRRFGGILSFELRSGYEGGKRFIDALRLCTHAVSLGTTDTLVTHPASTTHVGVPRDARRKYGITDGLIRMSVGLENGEDLLVDISQALTASEA
jgi:methionine-gamma-lyase